MKQHKLNLMSNSQLADALQSLDIEFLLAGKNVIKGLFQIEDLIAGLSCCNEARLRLALIPLFLQHPQFATIVPSLMDKIPHNAQIRVWFNFSEKE